MISLQQEEKLKSHLFTPSVANDKVIPELTLVLIGDKNSIVIRSKNLLIDHDDQTNERWFSPRLYDLCGRNISVINMLNLENTDRFPLYQEIHAFLLLLPYGQHNSQYRSGMQWLKKAFGEESLSNVMTVVTHESDENCESALTDLKTNIGFFERRYHTCGRCMTDEKEILDLLEKIDTMVSENSPRCSRRWVCERKKHLDHKSLNRIRENETEIKWDPVNEPDNMERLYKTDDITKIDVDEVQESSTTTQPANCLSSLCTNLFKSFHFACFSISEEISKRNKFQAETKTLFKRLHLLDKLQQKLTPSNFLKVHPPVKQNHVTSEKDLTHTFLQRLMSLDYRSRYIPVKQNGSKSVPDMQDTEDDSFRALLTKSVNTVDLNQTVHPMDVQMAVFHCSDSLFKQNMITKLSQCQYALPLLVPHPVSKEIEFPLWTFRQINKTWKITQHKGNSNIVIMKSMPIYKAETPMVSFFRLGSLSVSKSQLMNTLINDRHSTFFHRNCPGSTKSRLLMDGVAEIAWYCPAGKPNDAFTDCVTFCNLHGDGLLNEQQRNLLTEWSSINVVFVTTLDRGNNNWTVVTNLYQSPKPLIILIADDDCCTVQMKERKYKIGLKDKNQSDVSAELKEIIGKLVSGQDKAFQLETMAEVSGIKVDEHDTACKEGKCAAMEIMNLFQGMDVSEIKDKFLPCQGKLWHDWCRKNTELYHLQGNIENNKSQKEQKLITIREAQCTASHSEAIVLFIKSLSSLPPTEKQYFMKWTQILIDALSTDDITSILQGYETKWSEVLALKKDEKSDLLKTKQTELEQISKKLQSTSFGLEHIFREMGQIYEAHKSLKKIPKKIQTDWSKYPELAAELMISGHPMELMDGDADHVPLTWISSLFDEVIRKLDNKRVFVLSVLGVQSTGKSTMLNAMLGLQFAVSAGRCTRGAFMQLVKVSEEMKKDFKFDYVLVVDTEGLHALELAGNTTLHHDNKLATFVVGLGNMTLINIFGENPADMQDVLQIVVQAFMRMKQVKLSPSCVFVHQNVTDIAAAEKNMDGRRRLHEKLDHMTKLAAKEEVYDAECFSDIIAFDVQKDVKYFAQLWEGSPPMAPPNPGYSESVQELKNIIFSKASQSAGVTLSQFKSKIQDLWAALMNENFVLSFKNTLEMEVYRKLEDEYADWTWNLRENMLIFENQLYTRVEGGNFESSYLHNKTNKIYEEVKKDMTTYFESNKDKEILVQWKGQFETKIKMFHDEQVRKMKEVFQQKKTCKQLDDQSKFHKKLVQKIKNLAHQLREKAKDEDELQRQFDSLWGAWVSELTADMKPVENINLVKDQSEILQELGFEWKLIDDRKTHSTYRNMADLKDYGDYVSNHKLLGFGSTHSSCLPSEEQHQIRTFIDDADKQSMDTLRSKLVDTTGYSPTYLREVANTVIEKVREFKSQRKYSLKKKFTVDLLLFIFNRAESSILKSHRRFKMKNDPHTYLESKKDQYNTVFKSFCIEASSAVLLGKLICEELKVSTVEYVCKKTVINLAGEMRCNNSAFSGNRLNLEKHVLKSLAEKEKFSEFINYIQHPRKHVESFIKEEVNKYIVTDHKDKALNILKKNVEEIKELVNHALFTATEKVKTQRGDTDMWLKEFSGLLKDKMKFNTICSQNVSHLNDFDLLKKEIEKGLVLIVTELNSLSLRKMKDFGLQPDQILIDQLCRCCWAQCPFCKAVCTNTLENHDGDHSVPFHRSNAVNGWHYRGSAELILEFCTTRVASHGRFHPRRDSDELISFKLYKKAGPEFADWRITPDRSNLTYWKWFICQFRTELEEHYKCNFQGKGEIPREWTKHTKEEAIKSLDEMYNL